jgi:hydrophobe/amphiphile efflux-1 (HAE1) family protein
MSKFFIDRPIFAWVIAIVVMLFGLVAIEILPIAQYPSIAPPAIAITATYPGASSKTLEDTVTQVIEQNMKGLDNLSYMASTSESSGTATITLTFDNKTNPDTAQVQVQNKLALATPLLPQEVQRQGVKVAKSVTNFLAILGFTSSDGSMSAGDIADYVASHIQDPISRVAGVGDTQLFGAQHAMRIWLNPSKLDDYKLTPLDVQNAVQAQNAQVSAGQLGALPAVSGQELNAPLTSQSRLRTVEEFENILLRTDVDGSQVRLRDVARVQIGSESYDFEASYNGKPASALAIKLTTGANALDTIRLVDARIEELRPLFPKGLEVVRPYDTTPFVRISIEEVIKTLVEAIILVFGVMYLFLQNFRATLIPTIAVPVVLLGTFGVLSLFGYSINTLTMFAMVLAIGLLVDDAIVVVENVERVMREDGCTPREATRKSMEQISGALVGIALVLAAVFVPMAFFGGSTGVIYRQFSVTIVSAMALSVLVALILTPALCATILRPVGAGHELHGGFFGWFNRNFERFSSGYGSVVAHMVGHARRYMAVYVVLVAFVGVGFMKIPQGFLPDEDQGVLFTLIQLPAGATQTRTLKVLEQVGNHYLHDEAAAVDSVFTVAGFSFAGNGQNSGMAFVRFKPWDQRKSDALKVDAVTARAFAYFAKIRDAMVFPFAPPAVIELGNASGFDLMLQDRANLGHEALMKARNQLLGLAGRETGLVGVRPNGQDDSPDLQLTIDQEKAMALGVAVSDINATLSSAWGSSYVNDFLDNGRVKKVFLQADAPFRMLPQDTDQLYVRNAMGTMVPFSAIASSHWGIASPRLERYNGEPSVEILGMGKPGTASSGQAMAIMERLAAQLPRGIGYEWTGLSLQERAASGQTLRLYAFSILIVFLSLAALYESWAIPFAVILVIPLGMLGTVVAAGIGFKMNDVYFQVGLLTTIGLASKNAILIVEFAKDVHRTGKNAVEAVLDAARMRLRPILMTSLAFIGGVLPMLLGRGAGAGAQNALGTAVIGGMTSATLLAIVFVPVFFVLVMRLFQPKGADAAAQKATNAQPLTPAGATR